jgi:protein SCO1
MNEQIKRRLKRTGILCAIALLAGAAIGLIEVSNKPAAVSVNKPVAGVKIGGPFELTDQNGNTVTDKSFSDGYKLIYFGFTYCPAICPTELAKISKALKSLGDDAAFVQPLFLTVDPERDTPQVLKNYLTMFDPRIVGLTGPKDKVDKALSDYKIYAAKKQEPNIEGYTMDHSSFIYLIAADGALLSIYRMEDTADEIAADIRDKIEFGETN